ncbi:hypothetical protein [Mycobacterium sp. ACS4331]|uniref:hypothetical protein n=1 Tax=Mycobacterium sp. ACS4331 TaxID=1834121 RepID=UPI0007FF564C|nr:hypothetical protein [Mycobacterium sp. ACS4331]OBF21959.1 hypothetical protein A5727_08110 [Mycobacterium sp. ACS4331]
MHPRTRHGLLTRDALGLSATEAFVLIAVATILITRAYLELTGYPQIGGGTLHIAHALWGGALMMVALVLGWMTLGRGPRILSVLLGGVGFGLFLDEVGKFVTKDNDYFYGPAAEIMYILVVAILLGARVVREVRPLSARECLASAARLAADGLARGLSDHHREIGLRLVEEAQNGGADRADTDRVRALLLGAAGAPDRLYRLQHWAPTLIPDLFRSPRWVPIVGWLLVISAVAGVLFGTLNIALGGFLYEHEDVRLELDAPTPSSVILLITATLTAALAVPAMIGRRRNPEAVWPLRWLRNAALISTFLNALVDFATQGFGALSSMAIGLFTLAVLTYQLDAAAHREVNSTGSEGPRHRPRGTPESRQTPHAATP